MAIPASHIVNVIPRVITGGSPDLELNGLLLTDKADMIPCVWPPGTPGLWQWERVR